MSKTEVNQFHWSIKYQKDAWNGKEVKLFHSQISPSTINKRTNIELSVHKNETEQFLDGAVACKSQIYSHTLNRSFLV